mmetsp:Transcript_109265/g.308255  ORF Transcript_109265/g.308255 Transcript_109265/m.308255 type:complete len:1079 (-) Transcript_109265:87-3323(-)
MDLEALRPGRRTAVLRVGGMTCGACSSTVERALAGVIGVVDASVSCVTGLASVDFDPGVTSLEILGETVEDVGFDLESAEVQQQLGAGGETVAVELKVGGMTCSACSGTIERHLQDLPGVTRASVSLILNKAYVVCDPGQISPETLRDEIDDIGFDAQVTSANTKQASGGRANLHVLATPCCPSLASSEQSAADFDQTVQALLGVQGCQSTMTGHKRITYDPHVVGARRLLANLKDELGSAYVVEWAFVNSSDEQLQGHVCEMLRLRRDVWRAAPIAGLVFALTILCPIMGFSALSYQLHNGVDVLALSVLGLATPVQFYVGRRFHKAAFQALKRKSPNMDVLVSVATNTAYFYSVGLLLLCLCMPETAGAQNLAAATAHFSTMGPILIAVVLLGKFLEAVAKLSAMRAMTNLNSNQLDLAVVCDAKGSSAIPVEQVELGDVIRVYPGERIPVDGVVCSETTVHVDESLMTGESAPVSRSEGDLVIGGTSCISGGCLMRATRVGSDTTFGQMYQLVQDAQASKAQIQRTADKVARFFVPSVICMSVSTFMLWIFLIFYGFVDLPRSVHGNGHSMSAMSTPAQQTDDPLVLATLKLLFAMKFGMAVLMIACPCAMGLATPVAVMVATGVAARRGCLVKNAVALETSAHLDVVVLDKTGTITQGQPAITAAVCVAKSFAALSHAWAEMCNSQPKNSVTTAASELAPATVEFIGADGVAETDELERCFWWLLGTLESASDHPVAKCIQGTVGKMQGLPPIVTPLDFECLNGRGVRCVVDQLGGVMARVGNLRFFEETVGNSPEAPGAAELRSWVVSLQLRGHTVVILHVDGVALGAVALNDPIRPEAKWVVEQLKKTLGLEVWMCTGDNTATAQCIAEKVGIGTAIVAEALPSTKRECVQMLQRSGQKRVGFVGDGINDSLALAQADVGVAIGVGAQVVVEAADVALVRSDLSDYVNFLRLSKATFRTIILNFFWAFCFNFVCLPLAAGLFYPLVHIPPLAAGIGMACSSCLVVFSSLTLWRFRPKAATEPRDVRRRQGKSFLASRKTQWTALHDDSDDKNESPTVIGRCASTRIDDPAAV